MCDLGFWEGVCGKYHVAISDLNSLFVSHKEK